MSEKGTASQEQVDAVIAKAGEIRQRMSSDPALVAQYNADPLGTLVSAGLPEDAAHALVAGVLEQSGNADVKGYDSFTITFQTDYAGWIHEITQWYNIYGVPTFFTDVIVGHV